MMENFQIKIRFSSKNHFKILIMAQIPGSSYSHKNMRKFIYNSLNSDPAEELPALSEISKYFF
jgi:hypothetical protein